MRRLAGLVVVALAAVALVASQPAQTASAAPNPLLSETFGGTSVSDPAWKPLGSACLTAATAAGSGTALASCSSRVASPAVSTSPGFLQLTDSRADTVGGAFYDTAIPANGGLDITFDQYQYAVTGSGEGIAFFLADGAQQITTTGAGGASLGYAQSSTASGLPGAYLGVGLDAAGGFSTSAGGKGQGCTGTAPAQLANTVALRGPGSGTANYCYLARGAASASAPLRATATAATAAAPGTTLGRSIRITVTNAANPVVTVFQGTAAGSTPSTQVTQFTMTTPIPTSVKLGFTAATGAAAADTHLVRNLTVTSIDTPGTSLELVKAINTGVPQTSPYTEGSVVSYAFAVRPTGLLSGVAMSGVTITDPLATLGTCSTSSTLFPGSTVCTGTHTVTPAEAMSGKLLNTATARATLLNLGLYTSNVATLSVPIATPAPALSLTKVGTLTDANGNGKADVGERIAYSFTARNTGNVSLYQVAVTDPRVTGITPATTTLAPQATLTFTSSAYTVTQADVDAGTPIVNVASVTGRTLAGQVAPTATSSTTTPVNGVGALTLTKDAVLTGGPVPGATVAYTLRATNSGSVTLTGVTITDPLVGLSAMSYAWPGTAGTLAAGASVTATATYTVKQSDVDAGQVANTATAGGSTAGGIVAQAAASRVLTLARTATLDFTKTASPSNVVAAGSVVSYGFLVRNTGTTTLTGVGISDPRAGVSALAYTWPQTAGTLAPGQVATATATYTATAADVQAGSIVNTATATATTSAGAGITRTASATVTVVPDPLPDSATTPQGTAVVIDVLANDGRAATGATFSRAQLSATPKLIGGASGPVPDAPASGSVTCVDSGATRGSCTYSPILGFTGVDVFDYSLSSSVGTWNVRVTVTVTAVNRAAAARPDRIVATTGGPAVTVDPTANDTDPDGDGLAVTGATPPSGMRGTFTCTPALCTYTPSADGWTGTITIPYSATDRPSAPGSGIVVSSTITVLVDPAPLAPRGFHHRDTATQGVTTGTWTSTTAIGTATASCVAGRPVTALAWAATPGATAFVLERRVAGTTPGAWTLVARLGAAATTFSDDRVGESRSYQWRVRPDLERWAGVASAPTAGVLQPAAVDARGC